jgi:hypothetical protein
MSKSKMVTIEQRAVGSYHWPDGDGNEARIERNLFALDGDTWEALRFCKHHNGRHNRVHLVIGEDDFVKLFGEAVRNGVFHPPTLNALRLILENNRDPFLDVIGAVSDGELSHSIDSELYGDRS